jgi:hypothetical protein
LTLKPDYLTLKQDFFSSSERRRTGALERERDGAPERGTGILAIAEERELEHRREREREMEHQRLFRERLGSDIGLGSSKIFAAAKEREIEKERAPGEG